MIDQKISSPVTGQDAILINSFPKERIIKEYQKQLSLDVSQYFRDLEKINLYKCKETNYHFFYPYNIAGDGKFYEELQKIDWYYMPWKWEHKKTLRFLKDAKSVLEIGSGSGYFLKKVQEIFPKIIFKGLELNNNAIQEASNYGVSLIPSTIEEFSTKPNQEKFDIVCCYQVLEHIADVSSFIKSASTVLNNYGKLIISVPNNASFIKCTDGGILNFPPHHMGHWEEKSLTAITDYFDLKVEKILYEPLQKYNIGWYRYYVETIINKLPIIRSFYYKFKLKKLLELVIMMLRTFLIGHTIMVVYQKKN